MQPQHPLQAHQMQPMIPAFATTNITTEHIQKYLDENKQLILAILDNQNLGKFTECAHYQAKLQQNLMYLAAIADSQPQSQAAHTQIPPNAAMQPGAHYMQQHQQAQQQVAQSVMAGRVPMQYAQLQQEHQHQQQLQQQQQQLHHQQQHQQAIHSQLGISSGGNNGLQMLHSEAGMGGNGPLSSRGLPDFARGTAGSTGEAMQTNRGLGSDARVGNKQDGGASTNTHPGSGDGHGSSAGGHNADESEPSYLKTTEEEGN